MKVPFSVLLVFFSCVSSATVSITTTTLPNAAVNSPYSVVVNTTSGCTPFIWAVTSGTLPQGISATVSSNTRSLDVTGTPTTAGTYSFTISVTGCGGYVSQMSYTVVVQAGVAAITTSTLPAGTVGTPYSAAVNASGGYTPYTWSLVSGALPSGISLTPSNNTESLDLAGTPTAVGTYSFTISVTGHWGHVSEVSYTVVIEGTPYAVDLSWNASTSSDISGYNVYRSVNESTWEKLNTSLIGSITYDDATVVAGTTYYYAVTAVNTEGVESSKSTIAEATIP